MAFLAPLALALTLIGSPVDDPPIPPDTDINATESGLKYCVLKPGDGKRHATVEDQIKINYKGWLPSGKLFDQSKDGAPVTFQLAQLIRGWQEGIPLMTEGAEFKFHIPWKLGYGEGGNPRGGIPAKADLVFVVELLEIIPAPKMPDFHDGNPDKQTTTETGLVWEPIKTAEGERPKADSVVEIAYAMWTHDGQLRDCTERRGSNVRSGVDRLNPFLQESILLIPLGARYRFEVPPSLFYPPGTPDAQRGNDKFIFEIEVVSIIEPMPIPEFSALAEDKTTTTESGLKYEVIEKSGSGVKPLPGQSCKVHYAGWLTTGDLFDSSYSKAETFSFPLARRGVIPGWDEGVALMEKGDTFKFLIPGELAYGARGRPPVIPPNASLVFYIQLIDIE